MNTKAKLFLVLGSTSGALGVILGAFGAHGLKGRLSETMLANFMTGVEYQFYHAFALLVVGMVAPRLQSGALTASGWFFTVGIVFFSGSLYAMAFTGLTQLGAVTPIGGLAFIAGWVLLAAAAVKAG